MFQPVRSLDDLIPRAVRGDPRIFQTKELVGEADSLLVGVNPYSRAPRSRRAFATTDTELKLIAALAIIGLSSQPRIG